MNREKFRLIPDSNLKYTGGIQKVFDFVEEKQLLRPELWSRFVRQFREDADFDAGWRGEYWGKMMRGASLVYAYTKNETLYAILCDTVRDMIDSANDCGRISSYDTSHEFDGWDLWCRKYVLLGMQYFLDICKDDKLYNDVILSMKRQADYIIAHIGKEDGKTEITAATRDWNGLNSSSILEPIVRLYKLTNERKYLDFSEYIISCGGIDNGDIFELAYEDKLSPYQYPVTKAYEMISCFEGLLEYYKIVGNERHKTAIINFADKILKTEFTVIGSAGCKHELFDNSSYTQHLGEWKGEMQETCVTVTLMKFFHRVHLLTGNPKYADAVEISFYNAYLGALNTENKLGNWKEKYAPYFDVEKLIYEPLPFDSYSPLTEGTRGIGVGGIKPMSDNHYYGCCACIGSAGIGLIPALHYVKTEKGLAVNMFICGTAELKTPSGSSFAITTETLYPADGRVKFTLSLGKSESFEILIRNPEWSENTKLLLNGEEVAVCSGYISLNQTWKDGDEIELELDMRTRVLSPLDGCSKSRISLRRGPVMLARDSRLGYDIESPIQVDCNEDGAAKATPCNTAPYPCMVQVNVPLLNGEHITLTDYASAGKTWSEESRVAVWMKTE